VFAAMGDEVACHADVISLLKRIMVGSEDDSSSLPLSPLPVVLTPLASKL